MRESPWMILIGPAAAGKSTLGEGMAAATGRRFVDIDAIGADYYAEAGWDMDRLRSRIRAVGRVAAEREWEPARAHAVERAVADHPDAIIALGAGATTVLYTDADTPDQALTRLLTACGTG
ncbi:shikimate kinase [Nonomuraea sp. NPDC003560]|uniref:shikimate kinase n=1 Tax=Nonomuraea sp. NPDC003560 TaxID=3364341 RepID=UPI0036780A55